MRLVLRILVCLPAALHPTVEPLLADLACGVDEQTARAHLAALASTPGLRLFQPLPATPDEPLRPSYSFQAGSSFHFYVRQGADGCWRLTYGSYR